MRWIVIAMSSLFVGGIWNPPVFIPVTHPDGSRTWTMSMAVSDFPKADRKLSADELSSRYTGGFMGHYRFCEKGWNVTASRIEKKTLIIEGVCAD